MFDFVKNTVKVNRYEPMEDDSTTKFLCFFTETSEKKFLGAIYAGGLFDIEASYINDHILDGGGWELEIAFADGTSKKSTGSNAAPEKTFVACSQAFVDICGVDVLGYKNYVEPLPTITVSYNYTYNGEKFVYGYVYKELVGVKWNDLERSDNTLNKYYAASEGFGDTICVSDCDYNIVIDTLKYGDHKKFVNCQITSYNYDRMQSDMRIEKVCTWFDSIELSMDLDRIYVIMLTFSDGDFIEYVFNTRSEDSKPGIGIYNYEKGDHDISISLKRDNNFHFIYYTAEGNKRWFDGTYSYEEIGDKDRLVLTVPDGSRLVLDYYAMTLCLNREYSTMNITEFGFDDGTVLFSSNQWKIKK